MPLSRRFRVTSTTPCSGLTAVRRASFKIEPGPALPYRPLFPGDGRRPRVSSQGGSDGPRRTPRASRTERRTGRDGTAFLEASFAGTHTGEFAGVPPSGIDVRQPYCVAYDVGEDSITAPRAYFPMATLRALVAAAARTAATAHVEQAVAASTVIDVSPADDAPAASSVPSMT